jgi:hypothetical protein
MPAEARGHVRKLPSGKWQLRYYDAKGGRRSGGAFSTKSEAWAHFRDVVEPEVRGRPGARRDITLTELVDTFLDRHGKVAKPATIDTLRWRMKRPLDEFGDTLLVDLEHMTDDLAGFAARQPERFRHAVMSALRQTCEAGVRYGYMTETRRSSPGRIRRPLLVAHGCSRRRSSPASRRSWTREAQPRSGSLQQPGYGLLSGRP